MTFRKDFQVPINLLNLLMAIILGAPYLHSSLVDEVRTLLESAGLDNLLESLLAMAVSTWVFESDFSNFDQGNSASSICVDEHWRRQKVLSSHPSKLSPFADAVQMDT